MAKQKGMSNEFVQTNAGQFVLSGNPYRFLGTNFWYGMNLGAEGTTGDRARLKRELDRLNQLGVTNLRIVAATEGPDKEPWRITPSLQPSPGVFREEIFRGLDFLLSEMGKRGMKAVVCLGNFWPWSGGMSQFIQWSKGGSIPYPPPQEGGDWGIYQKYTQAFYLDSRALALYKNTVQTVVKRVNTITGHRYIDDPSIMAWELANEPRGIKNTDAFNAWIESTSNLIRSLDPNHLITTGVEGETPYPKSAGMDLVRNHSFANIDYITAHIWAQNWGWYEPEQAKTTYPAAIQKMTEYFQDHVTKAKRIGKPLVIEEFGLARDLGSYDPSFPTSVRDDYYGVVFEEALQSIRAGSNLAGINFWAWGGEATPVGKGGGFWRPGDAWIGDPPHEAQGWYSVYASDLSSLRVIRDYAERISNAKP